MRDFTQLCNSIINTIYHELYQYLLSDFALVHQAESIPCYIQPGGSDFHVLPWLRIEDKIKSLVGQEFSLTPTYTYCSKKTCQNNTEPKVVISGLTLMGNCF